MPVLDLRPALAELASPIAYERELLRLVKRHGASGRRVWQQDGLALADWTPQVCADVARVLAKAVSRGGYELGAVEARLVHLEGKARTLYRASITDTAVVAVVARLFRQLSESLISSRVFSYRPGASALRTVRELASWVRSHRAERPDPRTRGLFALRRDVARYGESIPVHATSPLWPLLEEAFRASGLDADQPLPRLVTAAVRPQVRSEDGRLVQLERGVPTGSAIQPVICNLYLGAVDRALGAIDGAFYARFGDDILFLHPDAAVVQAARTTADTRVTELELAFKAEKSKELYFNGSGRSEAGFRGATSLEYLGLAVAFTGAVGLPKAKSRRLLREVERRAENVCALAAEPNAPAPHALVCEALARALDPRNPVADPLTAIARHAVDDRSQLRHLDYLLALKVAERLARRRGVRAFREFPYQELRGAGLPSLLHARNTR